MSIATEIQRLNTAKADLKAAINLLKGSAVITNETIDEYASAMAGLPLPAVEEEFVEKTCPHNGPAQLLKVYGKSVVNNQLVQNGDFSDGTSGWASAAASATMSVTDEAMTIAKAIPTAGGIVIMDNPFQAFAAHKYYISVYAKSNSAGVAAGLGFHESTSYLISGNTILLTSSLTYEYLSGIVSPVNNSDVLAMRVGYASSAMGVSGSFKGVRCIDLTLRFGAGHEPTSVDEALRLLGGDAFDPTYDPGSLQSNKTSLLRAYDGGNLRGSLALNLSTLTGKLNGEGASVVVYPDGLRGVGTDRDAAYGSTGEVARAVVDLGQLNWAKNSDPRGTYFWARIPNAKAVAGYLVAPNAICANYLVVSGAYRANKTICQYNPDTSDEWMIYDSVYDSADPATFKAAMSGVMLDYPLATSQTYTLDTPLPTDLTCEQGDILQRVSDNNCPFVGNIEYKL